MKSAFTFLTLVAFAALVGCNSGADQSTSTSATNTVADSDEPIIMDEMPPTLDAHPEHGPHGGELVPKKGAILRARHRLQQVEKSVWIGFGGDLDDLGFGPLAMLFKQTAIEEMGHVELLAERILFLKGDVEMGLAAEVEKITDPSPNPTDTTFVDATVPVNGAPLFYLVSYVSISGARAQRPGAAVAAPWEP